MGKITTVCFAKFGSLLGSMRRNFAVHQKLARVWNWGSHLFYATCWQIQYLYKRNWLLCNPGLRPKLFSFFLESNRASFMYSSEIALSLSITTNVLTEWKELKSNQRVRFVSTVLKTLSETSIKSMSVHEKTKQNQAGGDTAQIPGFAQLGTNAGFGEKMIVV